MTQTWINGLAADPTLGKDRGLQFGDGLFETIAVINGVPRLWERHFFRLQDGCEQIGRAHVRTPVTSLSRMPSSA